jgi:5-methylcytosine-specific restriction enzyme subunit McrC
MRTTDNTKKQLSLIIETEQDRKNLSHIAQKCDFDIEKNRDLLIFPKKWQLGIKSNNKIFEIDEKKDELITNNIMGFIGYNETKLTISSRFYPENNDFFLHYMLSKVFGINVVNLNFSQGAEDIHDFLPYLFPSYLQEALSQGLYKQYKRNQYNDANVKGVIDINRHLKINIPFAGKIAYTTREHSYDNSVTQLIRHTIEHLRTCRNLQRFLTNNAETKANVLQIEQATLTYKKNELQKVIKENLKLINHPYFTKYRDLQKLCLQILRREKTNFGAKDKIHGLLFDGAWLWEEYIATILKEIGIEHRVRGKTKIDMLFKKDEPGIIPDFIKTKSKNSAEFIGDAKYKHIDAKDNREDYFQIITYMFRYSCQTGYIIFPNKNDYERPREIDSDAYGSQVIEFGLKIPSYLDNFNKFVKEIEENEKKLNDYISDILSRS